LSRYDVEKMKDSKSTISISLVLPVFNEAAIIDKSVRTIAEFLDRTYGSLRWELIVADNKSTDGTYQKALATIRSLGDSRIRAIYVKRRGVGAALRSGWSQSTGDVLAYVDADLPFRLSGLRAVIDTAMLGPDVVIGSRYAPGGEYETTRLRRFLSRSWIHWLNLLFACEVTDNCGIRSIKRSAFLKLLPSFWSEGWFFGAELIVLARRASLRLVEVPVQCVNNRSRPSSVRLFSTILGFLRLSLTLRIHISAGSDQ